eukprot:1862416-Rhodomonas_salina.1
MPGRSIHYLSTGHCVGSKSHDRLSYVSLCQYWALPDVSTGLGHAGTAIASPGSRIAVSVPGIA